MPQMFPMLWTSLFVMVILLYTISMTKLFFLSSPAPSSPLKSMLRLDSLSKWVW